MTKLSAEQVRLDTERPCAVTDVHCLTSDPVKHASSKFLLYFLLLLAARRNATITF
jgi:hypothetical protein